MKLSGVTVVMPLPEIMAIITQITIFVNPDPKLVHLFPAMWESFKRKFYLEDSEETWKGEYYFMVSPKIIPHLRSYLSHDFLSSILSAVACESIRFSFTLRHWGRFLLAKRPQRCRAKEKRMLLQAISAMDMNFPSSKRY